MPLTAKELAGRIDHTLLRPEATAADIARLCAEAREHGFHAVCVHGSRVVQAAHLLSDTAVKVAAVVGFPLGATDADAKRFEVEALVDLGAQELDAVLNIGRLRDGDDRYVFRELRDLVEAAEGVPLKVILECAMLTADEKHRACSLVVESGAQFVKTSTGFGPGGATMEDVTLLRSLVGPKIGVKASGGIRTLAAARSMLDAGASRIGSSAGVAILAELKAASASEGRPA
ncbi:MAG: deoxyribose-phosphate aldolase [Verrucomicrobiales bacterium]|nr:deoxyribose-phosphate aldolase [Verrucomicrobiales bacterium]